MGCFSAIALNRYSREFRKGDRYSFQGAIAFYFAKCSINRQAFQRQRHRHVDSAVETEAFV